MIGRTLLVTNDFPPRPGGIQQFVHNLAVRQPPGSLVAYCSTWRGADKFDADQPFPVVREETSVLLPTPQVTRRAVEIAQEYGCDSVWFGAAAPLGLLAAPLKERAGVTRAVALTHGHEVGWAALPGAKSVLRRIARRMDVVTYLGEYFRVRLDRAIGDLTTLERLAPGVDTDMFAPSVSGAEVRAAYGLTDRPVVVCVSRLVPRKGQDTLIKALPRIRRRVARRRPAAGRGRTPPVQSGATGGGERRRAPRRLHRHRAMAAPAGALRRRRRVRHAMPDAPGWARRRGTGHRLPRGVGERTAGRRR